MQATKPQRYGPRPRAAATAGQRPAAPDAPMLLEGALVRGDTRFMVRCLAEELLVMGTSAARVRQMGRDPNFQALHAARLVLGDEEFDRTIGEVAARVGVHRVRMQETPPHEFEVSLTLAGKRLTDTKAPSIPRKDG
jgi:hypothetical protein